MEHGASDGASDDEDDELSDGPEPLEDDAEEVPSNQEANGVEAGALGRGSGSTAGSRIPTIKLGASGSSDWGSDMICHV